MRAGFYECDVTPPLGCFMWGSYKRKFAAEVHNKLFAKAVVIENEGNVTVDAVGTNASSSRIY